MPRHAEIVRHWRMLLHIDAHRHGVTVKDLADRFGVTQRTVWRDLEALQQVGFPLVDDKRDTGAIPAISTLEAPRRNVPQLPFATRSPHGKHPGGSYYSCVERELEFLRRTGRFPSRPSGRG